MLVYALEMQNSVLYVFESETNADTEIDLQDMATNGHLGFKLPGLHGALALIEKTSGSTVARYGF